MAFKPTVKEIMHRDSEGAPVIRYEGTHLNAADKSTLPTTNVYQGSWSQNLENRKVAFWNGTSWTGDE